jgi:predicted nucleotidyltransferase
MELELSGLLGGRKVDLNTPGFFGKPLRDKIMREAVVEYGEP